MNRPSYLLFKKCSKCGEILHVSRYYKKKSCKYGVNSYCKECQNNQNKEYNKKYREEHRDYYNEYNKKYREEHKDYYNEYNKNYKINNPEKILNNHVKRRNNLENQGNGITKEQWLEMMNFFEWKCAYSDEYIGGDSDKRTIDHIVALDNGGEHEIWNLVPMYANYNYSKSTKNMLEWYLEQEYFDIDRLTKIYEWRIYAYWKWKE